LVISGIIITSSGQNANGQLGIGTTNPTVDSFTRIQVGALGFASGPINSVTWGDYPGFGKRLYIAGSHDRRTLGLDVKYLLTPPTLYNLPLSSITLVSTGVNTAVFINGSTVYATGTNLYDSDLLSFATLLSLCNSPFLCSSPFFFLQLSLPLQNSLNFVLVLVVLDLDLTYRQ